VITVIQSVAVIHGSLILIDPSVCTVLASSYAIHRRCIVQTIILSHSLDSDTQHIVIGVYKHPDVPLQSFLQHLTAYLHENVGLYPTASIPVMGDWNVDCKAKEGTQHFLNKVALESYMTQLSPAILLATPLCATHHRLNVLTDAMLDHAWSTLVNDSIAFVGTCYYSYHEPTFTALPTKHALANSMSITAHPYLPPEPGNQNTHNLNPQLFQSIALIPPRKRARAQVQEKVQGPKTKAPPRSKRSN